LGRALGLSETEQAALFIVVDGVGWDAPDGGFFAVLDIPVSADDVLLERAARGYGVRWTPMSMFYAGRGGERQIRLPASYLAPAEIEEGVRRLARLLASR
jgi:(S)-3,5-dihydroxyphenylglycine transaminase